MDLRQPSTVVFTFRQKELEEAIIKRLKEKFDADVIAIMFVADGASVRAFLEFDVPARQLLQEQGFSLDDPYALAHELGSLVVANLPVSAIAYPTTSEEVDFVIDLHVPYEKYLEQVKAMVKTDQTRLPVKKSLETVIEISRTIQYLQDHPDEYEGELEIDSRDLIELIPQWAIEFENDHVDANWDSNDDPYHTDKYVKGYYNEVDRFVRYKLEQRYGIACFSPEWCQHCNNEVKLLAVMKAQKCPECGKELFPCTLCTDKFAHQRDCENCPLEK